MWILTNGCCKESISSIVHKKKKSLISSKYQGKNMNLANSTEKARNIIKGLWKNANFIIRIAKKPTKFVKKWWEKCEFCQKILKKWWLSTKIHVKNVHFNKGSWKNLHFNQKKKKKSIFQQKMHIFFKRPHKNMNFVHESIKKQEFQR